VVTIPPSITQPPYRMVGSMHLLTSVHGRKEAMCSTMPHAACLTPPAPHGGPHVTQETESAGFVSASPPR
jgi:hypothetical protein